MTSRCRTIRNSAVPVARDGATLTEVLISIMVMSIGVLSVMAMFPISILRSIQATQLTNAAILRENVRQQIAVFPEVVLGAPQWTPDTSYSANDLVVPRKKPGHRFTATNRMFRATGGGTSSFFEPKWPSMGTVTDGGVTWTPETVSAYVVDPLGWIAMEDALGMGAGDRFGNFEDSSNMLQGGNVRRFNANVTDFNIAAHSVSLPDSWVVVIDDVPTGMTDTSATFGGQVDLGTFSSSSSAPTRVVVTSFDGTRSVVRLNGVSVSTNSVMWSDALPASLDSANEVSSVRVETFERRYTWLITARRSSTGHTKAQCVVLFNRSLNPNDEYLYQVTAGAAGATTISLQWRSDEPEPLIREGNYLFDGANALWYRIQSIDAIDTMSSPRTATISLDRPAELDFGTAADSRGGVMFMPGIIDIFEL
ncbi:hypothetical protein [Maioricimonas sp. JC845]|uniref:type IV pilus modification PilV family protein n=1 Tax=Maioricimonas sp. JC845 TaxID=3232138 RepID=UPI0034580382